jgi:hypothetical protein
MAKSSSWEKKLAQEASKSSAREKARGGGGGNRISTKKRRFTLGDEKIGREMDVVVLDFVYLNTYYGNKFKEGAANVPVCFALSEDGEDMEPHKNVRKPKNDECESCPMNEWGSGHGRGKACQGRRRLALIHVDDIESVEDIQEAAIATIELPVTSVQKKGKDNTWSAYIKTLGNELHRPPYSVVTHMAFDEDESYPVPTFELSEKIKDQEIVEALKERIEEARKILMEPYDAAGGKEDADDEGEDEDEDDEDEKPRKKGKKSKYRKEKDDEDDDEDDEDDDEEDDEDEEEDEEDSPRRKRAGSGKAGRGGKKPRRSDDDDDDEDEDDEDDDEDDDDADEDGDDEDEPKRKKKSGSRFGK